MLSDPSLGDHPILYVGQHHAQKTLGSEGHLVAQKLIGEAGEITSLPLYFDTARFLTNDLTKQVITLRSAG